MREVVYFPEFKVICFTKFSFYFAMIWFVYCLSYDMIIWRKRNQSTQKGYPWLLSTCSRNFVRFYLSFVSIFIGLRRILSVKDRMHLNIYEMLLGKNELIYKKGSLWFPYDLCLLTRIMQLAK